MPPEPNNIETGSNNVNTEVSEQKFNSTILIGVLAILFNPVWAAFLIKDNFKNLGKDKIGKNALVAAIVLLLLETAISGVIKVKYGGAIFFMPFNLLYIIIVLNFFTKDEKVLINKSKRSSVIKPLLYGILTSIVIVLVVGYFASIFFNI